MDKLALFIRNACCLMLLVIATGAHAATPQEKLYATAEAGDVEGINAALKAGAKVNAKDADGWGALLIAATGGKVEAVEALVAARADVNAAIKKGETPLMGAALSGSISTESGHNSHRGNLFQVSGIEHDTDGGKIGNVDSQSCCLVSRIVTKSVTSSHVSEAALLNAHDRVPGHCQS